MKERKRKPYARFLYGLLVIAGLYGINYALAPDIFGVGRLETACRPHYHLKFDKFEWARNSITVPKENRSSTPGMRYLMVDSLLNSRVLIGMERERVNQILGTPDAGVINKESVKKLEYAYSGLSRAEQEILDSKDRIELWAYYLAHQTRYPARSIWYPMMFGNSDEWKLIVKVKNDKVIEAYVN